MKRGYFIYFVFIAALLSLWSCSEGSEVGEGSGGSDVSNDATYSDSWDIALRSTELYDDYGIDNFGISIYNEGGSDYYTYENVEVRYESNTWTITETLLWQDPYKEELVVAYAPYDAANVSGLESFTVGSDQSTLSGYNASDLMVASSAVTPNGEQDTTNDVYYYYHGVFVLNFHHILSKLSVALTLGDELTEGGVTMADVESVTIEGCKSHVAIDKKTGTITGVDSTSSISGYYDGESYNVILAPQTIALGDFKVIVTIGGKSYSWSSSDAITLVGGDSYALSFYVGGYDADVNDFTFGVDDFVSEDGDIVGDMSPKE